MSLINTRLLAFRAQSAVDKWETRASRWGALDAFMQETEMPGGIISDELKQKALAAVGSTLEVPVIDYDSGVSISNVTQPVTVVGDPSTSQLYSVSFTQYYFGFLIHPAAHHNNEIKIQREFNEQLTKYIYKFLDTLDQACMTALEAGKTQVLSDTLGGRYSLSSNVVVAPLAEQDAFVGDLNPLMHGNDYYGPLRVVANPSMESHIRNRLLEKGEFNSENKQYQYNDKIWHFTNNLSNGAGHKATCMAWNVGSVGMVQQFGVDNLMRNRTHKHEWDIDTLPIGNIRMGTYYYDDAVNAASINGAASAHLTATKVQAYGFHTAIAFLTPYTSDIATYPASIMKAAIATS